MSKTTKVPSVLRKKASKSWPLHKAREIHSLMDMDGPLIGWSILPEQLEAMVEKIVENRMPISPRRFTKERLERLHRMMTRLVQQDLALIGIIQPRRTASGRKGATL